MRNLILTILISLFSITSISATNSFAMKNDETKTTGQESPKKPIMIIRFNDNQVEYEKQLEKVVTASLDAKKDVQFLVVANTKNKNVDKVTNKIQEFGVAKNNITTQLNNDPDANKEIKIFVR